MKYWILLFIPVVALASQDNPTRQELLQTVKHIQQLAIETQQELDAEKQAHASTKNALVLAQQATNDTQGQFDAYRKAVESEIQKGNKAIVSLAALVKKHHRDLAVLIGLWLGFCALLYFRIGMGLGIAGIIGAGAIAAAGTGFILWRL